MSIFFFVRGWFGLFIRSLLIFVSVRGYKYIVTLGIRLVSFFSLLDEI